MAYRHRLIYQVWLVVINMKKVLIILSIISFLIGQTNPIDIATTGANKLRMHGQLNIFQNPATLGYSLGQIKIDSSFTEDSLNDFNENLEEAEDLKMQLKIVLIMNFLNLMLLKKMFQILKG